MEEHETIGIGSRFAAVCQEEIGRVSTRYLKSDHLVDFSMEKQPLKKNGSRECSLMFLSRRHNQLGQIPAGAAG